MLLIMLRDHKGPRDVIGPRLGTGGGFALPGVAIRVVWIVAMMRSAPLAAEVPFRAALPRVVRPWRLERRTLACPVCADDRAGARSQ